MSTFLKAIGLVVAIGLIGSALPSKDIAPPTDSQPRKDKERPKVDFLRPVYTGQATVICPLDILFDRREGSGLAGATKAASTIFGRSDAVKQAGCQEWRAGQRLYIASPEAGQLWQKATPYEDSPPEYLVFSLDLTNSEK